MSQKEQKQKEAQEQEHLDAEAEFAAAFSSEDGQGDEPPANDDEDAAAAQSEVPGADDEPAEEDAAGGQEPGQDGEPKPAQGDEADVRRKAQQFDATEGRLRKAQEENARLKAELAQAKAPKLQQPKALAVEELPEELRHDVEAFAKENPDLAAVMLEDSREGKRLRRALEENGPGSVIVEDMAERMAKDRAAQAEQAEHAAQASEATSAEHFEAIGRAHPDFAKAYAARGENPGAFEAYRQKLENWAEEKPGKEFKRISRILAEGTTTEVIEVLAEFKKEMADHAAKRREDTNRAAAAGTVPKGKPSPPPDVKQPDKGDYDAGWEKAGKN
ncbi:MAG: hypothetical protein HY916_09150 [Desulfovibrio sp.]|jgi:hypothetical protein|nr:hypothetical protein [Desulfovibrio sp.]